MPDIEFQDVVGEIEQAATRHKEHYDPGPPEIEPDTFARQIRQEQERSFRLAARLMA